VGFGDNNIAIRELTLFIEHHEHVNDKRRIIVTVVGTPNLYGLYFTFVVLIIGMKTKMVIFGYRKLFWKFYRNLGLNRNKNGYRKYRNGIGRKTRNRKRKRFGSLPTVSENYRFIRYFIIGNKFGIFQKKY
jgi:hypothetical protein